MTGLIPFNRKSTDLMNVGFNDFSNMLEDFFSSSWPTQRSLAGDTFKLDIQDNKKEYIIEAELPGVKKEDIDITLSNRKLNISIKKEEITEDKNKNYVHRERKCSKMARSIMLEDGKEDGIQAKLNEGVLTIIVGKNEKVDTSKRIIIE